jgi:hypothetical protein
VVFFLNVWQKGNNSREKNDLCRMPNQNISAILWQSVLLVEDKPLGKDLV